MQGKEQREWENMSAIGVSKSAFIICVGNVTKGIEQREWENLLIISVNKSALVISM